MRLLNIFLLLLIVGKPAHANYFFHRERRIEKTLTTQKNCNDAYKYGFNGKMKDNEWAGIGNHLDFGARMQDTRIARFISIDPLTKRFPYLSSYAFAANSPIRYVDVDGMGPGDRIAKAKSFLGLQYSQIPKLNGGAALRTGISSEALQYLDCSEFVCRVMKADGISSTVKQYSTKELKSYLNNEMKNPGQFEKSMDNPQAGDIFLWRDADGHGHTGLVQSIEGKTIHTLEAYGTQKGVITNKMTLGGFKKHDGFEGFFHPTKETPDGKNLGDPGLEGTKVGVGTKDGGNATRTYHADGSYTDTPTDRDGNSTNTSGNGGTAGGTTGGATGSTDKK